MSSSPLMWSAGNLLIVISSIKVIQQGFQSDSSKTVSRHFIGYFLLVLSLTEVHNPSAVVLKF